MDFRIDDAQRELRADARSFADEYVRPGAAERDKTKEFPFDVIRAAGERGFLSCLVPAAYGGSAVGNIGQCLVLEEIAAACASVHVTLSVHNSLVCAPIASFGTDEQKSRFLPKLATGKWLGCYLLTEAGSGSDAAAMKSTAVIDGDHYVLNGDKMWITTGDVARIGIVFARTDLDPKSRNSRSISAFIVDFESEGISFGKREEKLGLRGSSTVAVYFKNVRIPAENLLGELHRGFPLAMDVLNGGRIGIAVQSLGIAREALEAATDAARSLERDGVPVTDGQLARFRLAESATKIEAGRLLCHRAAQLRDLGDAHSQEASMAKLFCSTAANEVCREAVALLGESAYDDGLIVERLMRDVRVTELYEGTTEIQKLVIAKQLFA